MARPAPSSRRLGVVLVLAGLVATLLGIGPGPQPAAAVPMIAPGSAYRQANLVSDLPGVANVLDPNLVNPWGLTATTAGFWAAADGTSRGLQYRGASVTRFARHQTRPSVNVPGGLPTGVVSNPTADFDITSGSKTGPASTIYASITGNIVGWSSSVPSGSTNGIIAASNPGHVYTGLAIASSGGSNYLYAADFANGTIDVFNANYALVAQASFPFADPTIPATAGNTYHPYNIQAVGSSLYVTYAKVASSGRAEDGVGNGFVRRFNTAGVRDLTFGINNGALNAPWGVTLAPVSFGIFGGALLVGNNGDGNPSLHAYNPTTGAFLGTLQDDSGNGIAIEGLWALRFGAGSHGGRTDTLFFTAGLGNETHGLLGAIGPTTATATSTMQFSSATYTAGEGAAGIDVTVTRDGNVSAPATVRYATWSRIQAGSASQKNDHEIAVGILTFAPGQTSRTFTVLPIDDRFVEGTERIELMLSNPLGTGVGGGSPSTARLDLTNNDASPTSANPIDNSTFYVRQQYLDFLNRQSDPEGLAFWVNRIEACGSNAACRTKERVAVSANFFLSAEFQNGASAAFRANRAARGVNPEYGDVMFDVSVYKSQGAAAFFAGYVERPEFADTYASLSNAQYVEALIANTGVAFTASQRSALINGLNGATKTRAGVLREITDNAAFKAAEVSRAFVLSQYFGYLRRNSDLAGYTFWLDKLAANGGDYVKAGLVKSFSTSPEYRQRFGTS